MSAVKPIVQIIPEVIRIEGKRLGRHRMLNWTQAAKLHRQDATAVGPVFHNTNLATCLNQGPLGSCTGNATAHCASSQPYTFKCTEDDAVKIYELATQDDDIPGTYPPDDTGSTGFYAMEAAETLKYFSSYAMCVGLTAVLQQLQTRAGITGIDWYEGFDSPDANGVIVPTGRIRGGHELCLAGIELAYLPSGAIDTDNSYVVIQNSWGGGPTGWGVTIGNRDGCCRMSLSNYELILASGGDATFPAAP